MHPQSECTLFQFTLASPLAAEYCAPAAAPGPVLARYRRIGGGGNAARAILPQPLSLSPCSVGRPF